MTKNRQWLLIYRASRLCIVFMCVLSGRADKQECTQNTTVTMVWWECPPFAFTRSSNEKEIKGKMYHMLKNLIATCCPGARIQVKRKYSNAYDLEKNITNETFAFPVTRSSFEMRSLQSKSVIFLPVLQSEGMFLLRPMDSDANVLMGTLKSSWPLLLIILGCTGLAGIFVWALDTYGNPTMFPRPFLQGFWEGFWCAYVTMATVGYGDRTPQSVAGRLFMFVWIIMGIVMVAVFTASLTSSLTSQDALKADIYGQRVRVLKGSRELVWAISNGARVKVFQTLEEMYQDDSDGDKRGDKYDWDDGTILLDSLVALHFSKQYKNTLQRSVTIFHPVHHGFLFQGPFQECAIRYTMQNRFDGLPQVDEIDPDHHKIDGQEASEKPYKLIRSYQNVNFIILGLFGLLFCIILIIDVLYRHFLRKRKEDNIVHVDDTLKGAKLPEKRKQEDTNKPTQETMFAKWNSHS